MIEEKKDCCAQHDIKKESEGCKDETMKEAYNAGRSPNQILITVLVVVVALNILTMGFFTYSVNGKLNEAIDLTKPQKAKLTLVRADDCPLCGDLVQYKNVVKAQNVELSDDVVVGNNSEEGKQLIKDFGLTRLPALVLVTDENLKSEIAKTLEKDSRRIGENTIVWEKASPPYLDVQTKNISGLVDVVYITDKRCANCYSPVQMHRQVLQNYGVAILSEKTVDVLDVEGKELVSKYKIDQVPTVILMGAENYGALLNVWRQVGTAEPDGALVFRKNEVINQTYKDLATDRVVLPTFAPTQTQ